MIGEGLPFFQGKADFGHIHPIPRYWCTSPTRVAEQGDILFSVRAPVGPTNILNEKACIGRGLAAIRVGPHLDMNYFYWFCKANEPKVESMATGSTFRAITTGVLKSLQIPLPPLEIQRAIAAKLDAADRLRQLDQQLLTKYDELAQALFIDLFGDPVKNEKGTALSDLIDINPSKRELEIEHNEKVDFVPMAAVGEDGCIRLTEKRSYSEVKNGFTYFAEGDVLFAKITPCMENGKGCIVRGLSNGVGFGSTEFHVLRPKQGLVAEFVFGLTRLESFRDFAEQNMTGSAGQKRVPKSFFSLVKLDEKRLSRQEEFATAIHRIEGLRILSEYTLQKSQEMFASLLNESFTN